MLTAKDTPLENNAINVEGFTGEPLSDRALNPRAGVVGTASMLETDAWVQLAEINPNEPAALYGMGFDSKISADGKTLVQGAFGETVNGAADAGALYIYNRNDAGAYVRGQRLIAPIAEMVGFGAYHELSRDGQVLAVSSYGPAYAYGLVHMYELEANLFVYRQTLRSPLSAGLSFGVGGRPSMSRDGAVLVVDDSQENANAGVAFIFTREMTGQWAVTATLAPNDAAAGDFFSGSRIDQAGSTLVAGAMGKNGFVGAAYIFAQDPSGAWSQRQKLVSPAPVAGDFFGAACSLNDNGDRVAITSYGDSANVGAVFIFDCRSAVWALFQKLVATVVAGNDHFGVTGVELSADGRAVLVSGGYDQAVRGAAYVFRQTGATFVQEVKLTAANGIAGDFLGASLSFAVDGEIAFVGARGAVGGTGTSYLFAKAMLRARGSSAGAATVAFAAGSQVAPTPTPAANIVHGFQAFAATTGATTLLTIPAGKTGRVEIAIACSVGVAAAAAAAGQARGTVTIAGAGVTPPAGTLLECEALAGANAAGGTVGGSGANADSIEQDIVAPAGNSVTVQVASTQAGTTSRVSFSGRAWILN